ncbi:non-ribosomal peptide synthetase [Numidum massiliense]|uniref:non-ribosomal peptide synthetase n=1 Tax=Numidum massiliense TaxID=1522315 RepID=UPI0006D52AD9|nr:non-ribosomal peptide synthetase [Numidum massiliense]
MTRTGMDTKKELARFLLNKVKQRELDPKLAIEYIKELEAGADDKVGPMAIIGLSCRFPEANDPDEFWDNLAAGRHSIRSLPAARVNDIQRIGGDTSSLMKAGYLDAVDTFDPGYFNIPPGVAKKMDPYHRLLLQVFVETIESAGYHRGQLHGRQIGVFVGNDHTHRLETSYLSFLDKKDFTALTGSWTGVLASRLSYLLNLRGPAIVFDTACSSTLVALDSAIKSIVNGDCEAALIGGANLLFYPGKLDGEIQSPDFRVRAFDRQAEGTAWGEGVAAVYIKPLSKALADRDHIYGVIRGIAINNDGKSNGLTAPSAKAQEEVLLSAWERANISPETISYIEAHGTGTSLGDPIEVKGLTGAFSKHTKRRQFCAIGSVKTNIGHTVGAAGLASLIKVLLSMKAEALPPSLNFSQPNQLIDFCNSPVYVQQCLADWPKGETPRRAGISSFSLSGTNAHVVVEEAPFDDRGVTYEGWGIFPISSRSPELLRETALRYERYVKRHRDVRWEDLCFTACIGREQEAVRAVVLCRDSTGLAAGLRALDDCLSKRVSDHVQDNGISDVSSEGDGFYLFLGTNADAPAHAQGITYDREASGQKLVRDLAKPEGSHDVGAWKQLSSFFVQGMDVDFSPLFVDRPVRRAPLPPTVFDDDRYWDETPRRMPAVSEQTEEGEEEGEVSRKSLWAQAQIGDSRFNREPQDAVERFAAWAWSEILGYDTINPDDDFYALGGDSITGLRIVHLINKAFALDLPLSVLMGSPAFDAFVHRLRHDFGVDGSDLMALTRIEESQLAQDQSRGQTENSPFPLSPAQNRMFLTHRLMPDSLAYNVTGVIKLAERESANEIEAIIRILVERHDSLRTSFYMEENKPVQVVNSEVAFAVDRKVLCDNGTKTREEVLQEELKKFIRPFDLRKAPLFRIGYFTFGDEESYLAIDMHHIITDGISMGVFFADYMSLAKGRQLKPLSFGYRDAVQWLCDRLEDSDLEQQREWWKNEFRDGIPVLNLPTDKQRPAVRDNRGARFFHTVPADLHKQIKMLAKQSGATEFMVLLAAFHNLLARLGGDRDIVIGTPVAGRPRLEFQHLVGMFVNTLPIRTKSEVGESFSNLLQRLKKTVIGAYENQEYPYELLIDDIKPERDPNRNPLFDVYFALQNIDMGLPGDSERIVDFEPGSAKFDLTVSARETSTGLLMEWEYAESLFYRRTIERMAKRYECMLRSIVKTPNARLGDLEIMEPEERQLLLEEWSGTVSRYPGERGIIPLFEQWVHERGDRNALVLDNQSMSYKKLNSRSNRIARAILEKGGVPGTAIALLLHRSFDMIAAILGVLKAGCHFVPLDSENPRERLLTIMRDSGSKLLVTHNDLAGHVIDEWKEEMGVLDLDRLDSSLPDDDLNIEVSGEDLAYIVYTSGSTGTPKGTLIRQKGIVRLVRQADYLTIFPEDVLLQLSNYSFDGAMFDIFGALLNGASLVLLHKEEVTDPVVLGERIRDSNVSLFFITTALFNALVDASPACLDRTRKVLFGGEAASKHHVRQAFERLGPGRLINVYGPTETTVYATYYPIDTLPEDGTIPIGKSIGNTELYVLDERMRLQPIGVPGELYIGGPGVATGYLNQPNLTKKQFVENPFQPGGRLYRTGDLVAWGDDGFLQYLGRRDQQVKLRGFRIELTEIEEHAVVHPAVREAFAAVHDDRHILCLWVVPETGISEFDVQDLRQTLAKRLPSYMVPTFITPLPSLPLNKNGKVDKGKLPEPTVGTEGQGRAPRNEREALLINIWAEVLGISKPSIDDNFFALGGDSIKAIQVVARMQQAGQSLQVADLFQYQTVESLAPHVTSKREVEAEQGEVRGLCVPSVIQSWFMRTAGHLHHFNQAMWIRKKKEIDYVKLEAALNRLCQHHDALRLAVSADGTMRIKGIEEGNLFYLTELPADLDQSERRDYIIEVQRHINIQDGPLVAAAVGRGRVGSELFIAIHHLAVDVVSWDPLLEDLFASLDSPDESLPQKTTPFPVWTKSLAAWAGEGGAKDELPYWRRIAKKAKEAPVPFVPQKVLHKDTVSVKHWIEGEIGEALCSKANRAYHTETVHLVLAVLAQAVGAWKNRSALLFNLEGHGREAFTDGLDVSRTAGWFTSVFPVLLQVEEEIGATVKAVKECVRSVPRRGFGFGVLRSLTEDLTLEDREALESLQSAISFNYLGVQGEQHPGAVEIEPLPADVTVDGNYETSLVLDIVAAQVGTALCLDIRYPRALFSAEEFRDLLKLIDQAATEVAYHCSEQTVGEKTASDFTVTPLEQEELENILDDLDIK